MRRPIAYLSGVTLVACLGVFISMAAEPAPADARAAARKQQADGNYRDAYETFHKLVLSSDNSGELLAQDLQGAVACLNQLQQHFEIDSLLDSTLKAHPDDWRVHWEAANQMTSNVHYGFIVAGEFQRGNQRGGGRYVSSWDRDRAQAIRWMETALEKMPAEAPAGQKANFYDSFASIQLGGREGYQAWKLQALTAGDELPDYEEGYYGWRGSSSDAGAPVDAEGNPVYHTIPESYETAVSDGQRWRWCLEQIANVEPGRRNEVDFRFASFLREQFDVQTLARWGIFLPRIEDQDDPESSGRHKLFVMHTLGENETIARLANGVKRFTLPDEFNFIATYRRLSATKEPYSEQALEQLATVFLDRQQYEKAAEVLRDRLERFGNYVHVRQQLEQIEKNWGQFEPVSSQAAGGGATVDYRFRNGNKVSFTAHAIKIDQLLTDIKQYIRSRPENLEWEKVQIENIGYRLVNQNESKYLGDKVASWDLGLKPRERHFDRRVTVTTPLQKAGAYLVTATMVNGNTSRIILWLDDTAIVKKAIDGKTLYYIADARTGQAISKANVEFFGWRQEYNGNRQGRERYTILTSQHAEFSDEQGFVFTDQKLIEPNYQWLTIARTMDGRLAHMGFHGIWYGQYDRASQYSQNKTYVVTDRPVYRPGQTVKFKFWMRHAEYGDADKNQFAGLNFTVLINDPQGTEIYKQDFVTDDYGGLNGELELEEEAKLGNYSVSIKPAHGISGGASFRVEEYKKPEFEVTIDAPDKPVQLGEKITAKVNAKYYFGAPVTEGTVKLKVERNSRTVRWYPYSRWDWLYGEGYWWFQPDYTWYRGFSRWGCFAPIPPWFNWNPNPPELVFEQEVKIGADGTLPVEIDTALAKELHPDQDHEYSITAEVTDSSRRTIVGSGTVIVARKPFNVFVWTNRGYFRTGDTIEAHLYARTADGNPVQGTGTIKLLKITYDAEGNPVEETVQEWETATAEDGNATQQIKASEPGQYRLSVSITSRGQLPIANGSAIEGGYLFTVRGEDFDSSEFRFNDLELVLEKREYIPGEDLELLVNTDRRNSTVLLFVRPRDGVAAGPPQVLHLQGKSTKVTIPVAQGDMPNFFVEAVTISNGDVHSVIKDIAVPPEKRVVNVEVLPSKEDYLPGQEAKVQLKLTDAQGEPVSGSMVMTMYDRAVEYISGGSNVPEIRKFFWDWKRHHHLQTEHSLSRYFGQLLKDNEIAMADLGIFGGSVADQEGKDGRQDSGVLRKSETRRLGRAVGSAMGGFGGGGMVVPASAAPMEAAKEMAFDAAGAAPGSGAGEMAAPTVRTKFADTAYWNGLISADEKGLAEISLTMPENLTGWKIRTWAMGAGTRVGEGSTEVTTSKNIIVRLQAPRFFVEKDEVVLSAVVHNYLDVDKRGTVELVLEGGTLEKIDRTSNPHPVLIPAGGEVRMDWRCRAVAEGTAAITMKVLTDVESDAMQMTFPVYVHGFLKTESFSGVARTGEGQGTITIDVPADRRPEQSRLEVRYSPTLAGAMVDALPYLVDYPYGCTEQTLNRFLPTVITLNILKRMNLDLKAIQEKRTNLNAQEIGDDQQRAEDWKRLTKTWHHEAKNPVFDEQEVARMVKQGVKDLTAMQLSDGGWGWFSGWGEHSYPHTTAVVVHGLQIAEQNGVALIPDVLPRGIEWLKTYQTKQVQLLQIGEEIEQKKRKATPGLNYRTQVNDIDSLLFMVLVDAGHQDAEMQRFLYRDRLKLSLYAQSLFGLALHKLGSVEQRDMVIRNIDQFLKVDHENQTAFIDLPNNNYWWYWYGSTIEANAFYLKLLTAVNPQDPKAAGIVKYLLNNRKHATYWNSTRDTAYCIEAMADYLVASGEGEPNMLVEVWVDGELKKSVEITKDKLFEFDNAFVLTGQELTTGRHTIELRKKPLPVPDGEQKSSSLGPLYYNAYLTNFTTEEFITSAGLEIKVGRKYYKLVEKEDATDQVRGSRGQVVDQKALKYERIELVNLAHVTSGDMIEIELEIDSKNDYEYIIFEDFKAAGCEPVDLRSGYTRDGLGAYVEFRDEKVVFFLRQLSRGKHSVSYRVRAEVPGLFSALPTGAAAMYAPELKGNSDEMKLRILDRE